MTLTLVLEHSPHPQPDTRREVTAGELTIGRDPACDWQIDDPDQYVSRRHCTVYAEADGFTVTDTSSGGLFIDGSDRPLGAGKSVTLAHGMRLRLGDFVIRAELRTGERSAPPPKRDDNPFRFDFSDAPAYEPPPERPADLPPRFRGSMKTGDYAEPAKEDKPAAFRFDDPFSLETTRAQQTPQVEDRPAPPAERSSGGGYFDTAPASEPSRERHRQREPEHRREDPVLSDPFADRKAPEPPAEPKPEPTAVPPSDSALRAAFFRGLGLAPDTPAGGDPEAEMEELGRRFRALTEGLMQLLRARAQEKQNVRVAQTVIGSADVNPLKFLPTPTEGVESLVQARGPGYLAPDAAIAASYRDLADHQARTWIAMQSALRRMIDRFDPDAIEKELEDMGLLETLFAGGRSAKLWQLYEERYKDIAKAAEDRFLGEVGADFREAYEDGKGR